MLYYFETRLTMRICTLELISSYVKKDPTAFCSYEDFLIDASSIWLPDRGELSDLE